MSPHEDLRAAAGASAKGPASPLRTGQFDVAPLAKDTLQDQVYRQLCELILTGQIAPGEQVTIKAISDAFGVSAMPVREALKRLTAADALTVVSGRSIGIPSLTRSRLDDLTKVRLEIEPLAGAWAIAEITDAEIGRARAQLEQLDAAARAGDPRAYLAANRAFHFVLYAASRSEVLTAIIERLWLQVSPYFHLLRASGNYASANEEHRRMLKAIEQRAAASLTAAICADIESAHAILAGMLRKD